MPPTGTVAGTVDEEVVDDGVTVDTNDNDGFDATVVLDIVFVDASGWPIVAIVATSTEATGAFTTMSRVGVATSVFVGVASGIVVVTALTVVVDARVVVTALTVVVDASVVVVAGASVVGTVVGLADSE